MLRRRAVNLPSIVLCAVCAGSAGAAAAQQTQQTQQPQKALSGKVSAGYLATSGNADSTNANASLSLLYKPDSWSHEFDANAVSATSEKVTTAEAYSFAYEAKRMIGQRAYGFASLEWDRDRFSAYERRTSEAGGYGWHLLATDKQTLDTEIGAGARQATRVDGLKQSEGILRGSLGYTLKVNGTTSFKQSLVVTSGSSNTYTESVSELDARLFGAVSLVLSYRLKHNSAVLAGKSNTDRFTAISLEYSF